MRLSDRNEQQLKAMGQEQRRANEIIAQKNKELEALSKKLSKYLSPQIYHSIFTGAQNVEIASNRKKLTIFFSDVVNFTETTDKLESEDLTNLLNRYLTEMSNIAFEHGATIDKYIGDAIMVFFGGPETKGVKRTPELAFAWPSPCYGAYASCRPSGWNSAQRNHSISASVSTRATSPSAISAAKIAWTIRSSAVR
jgi:class 3 adenylate cyclase